MKRLLSFLLPLLVSSTLSAQYVYTIKADSVKLSNCDSTELIIENHTQNVPGFLFNTGNGRTKFVRGLIQLNDSAYLIGADTLRINTGQQITGTNVFYVSKRYSGPGRAVVTGTTLSSISSLNPTYTSQLAKARPGSAILSYPDPFSARNAAMDAMAAGKIKEAQIVVLEGNCYTIGSDDSTLNGSLDGIHPNSGVVADIQFPKNTLMADTSIASFMKNKVNTYFSAGTAITYINSTYAIPSCYLRDTAVFTSFIDGKATFSEVYGEVNQFVALFLEINDRNADISFHAHKFVLQQWLGFLLREFYSCSIVADEMLTTDSQIFTIGQYSDPLAPVPPNDNRPPRRLSVRITNVRYGTGQTPYPDSRDVWYFIYLGNNQHMEGTVADISFTNLYMNCTNEGPLFMANYACMYNTHLTVNIDNLIQRDSHMLYDGLYGGLMFNWGPSIAINNSITYNIKSANVDAPLLGMMNWCADSSNRNNHFNLNVGNLTKNASAFPGGIFHLSNELSAVPGSEPLVFDIKGKFKSYDNASPIIAYNEWYSYPFANRYIFSGTYETKTPGQSVAHYYANMGSILAFTDAMLINDGVTPSIFAESTCTGTNCNCCQLTGPITAPVYIRNVHATSAPSSNVQQVGDSLKVVPDIRTFFN